MKTAIVLVVLVVIALFIIIRKNQKPSFQPPEVPSKSAQVSSRYADTEGVMLDLSRIPEGLRYLLPFAKEWAIGDDEERGAYAESVTLQQKKAFVDAVMPKIEALDSFHEAHKDDVPVPDEVVLFDMMAEAASELYHEVYPGRGSK